MSVEAPHLADERLLLLADGELPPRDAETARRHVSGCATCRTRFEQIEASAAEFARAYQQDRAVKILSTESIRRALQTQLADIGKKGRTAPPWAVACAILAAVLAGVELLSVRSGQLTELGDPHTTARPIAYLTPGATRGVATTELCAMRGATKRTISPRVRQAVVRDYRMELVSARDYELDYLITPELGGSDDRRNLWPERYSSERWNARVKDELELLLPKLVCAGTVPLATAQHDMATDWIAAYKKYFQTDRPLHTYPPFAPETGDDEPDLVPNLSFELPAPRSDYVDR
jgi:Putative zinc-finger